MIATITTLRDAVYDRLLAEISDATVCREYVLGADDIPPGLVVEVRCREWTGTQGRAGLDSRRELRQYTVSLGLLVPSDDATALAAMDACADLAERCLSALLSDPTLSALPRGVAVLGTSYRSEPSVAGQYVVAQGVVEIRLEVRERYEMTDASVSLDEIMITTDPPGDAPEHSTEVTL